MRRLRLARLSALVAAFAAASARAQVAVTTYHNDNARTGLNPDETILNPVTVSSR